MILYRLYTLAVFSLMGCSVRSEPQETPATAPITIPAKPPQSIATTVTKPVAASLPTSASLAPNHLVIERDRITVWHHERSFDIPNISGRYDTAALDAILLAIKKEHPQDDSMKIQASNDMPYAATIDITDVLRKAGFPSVQISAP